MAESLHAKQAEHVEAEKQAKQAEDQEQDFQVDYQSDFPLKALEPLEARRRKKWEENIDKKDYEI